MSKITEKLEKVFFKNYICYNNIYKKLCSIYFKDNMNILHLGAGADSLGMHRIKEAKFNFVSLDIDNKELMKNNNKNKVLGDAYSLPFRDGVFDLMISDAFFEHLRNPQLVLFECARVSKENASLIFTTPNKFSYIPLFNLYAPNFVKEIMKKIRKANIRYFPAYYKLNTRKAIFLFSKKAGYRISALHSYVGPPSYFNFSLFSWLLFAVLHRMIENIKFLSATCSIVFIGVLKK